MPSVSPQGSRGGLITAVVVFTIGFVISTIFAIVYGVALSKEQSLYKALSDRTGIYFRDTSSPRIDALKTKAHNDHNLPEPTVLAASIQESEDLAEKLVGKDASTLNDPSDALARADQALADAQAQLKGVSLPPDLVSAIKTISDYAVGQQQQGAQLQTTQQDAAAGDADKIKQAQALVDQARQDVAHANDLKQQALDAAQQAQNDKEKALQDDHKVIDSEREQFNKQLQTYQLAEANLNKQIDDLNKAVDQLTTRLARTRVSVEEPIVRQADGRIISVASDDVVYINLGMGDHIVPGMTFEVYDKADGIPKLGDGMSSDSMPIGLGSIEVERVYADSAQCRATLEPGKHISQGDLIANLVYDRNVKYNFFVYGKFDLGQTNHFTDTDRDKIFALVGHWGGNVQKDINVDTDFVVLGQEPTVDELTPDQQADPFYVRRYNEQKAELQAYDDILDKARQLHIPVMNQNRFLYFTGYYEAAQR
jgi:hypothetical protein